MNFTRNMRSVINLSLPEESLSFFEPSKATELRLKPLGFSNYAAAMSGTITNLTLEQQQALAKCLVGFRHSFTRNSTRLFQDGILKLRPIKLSLRQPLNIVHNAKFAFLDLATVVGVLSDLADDPVAEQPATFNIVCQECHTPKQAAHTGLRNHSKWNSIRCKICSHSRSSRQWLCICHVPWHSCPVHAIQGHACGLKEKANRVNSANSKAISFKQAPVNFCVYGPNPARPPRSH